MQWLSHIADQAEARHPSGEILIESGGAPSGTHHLGHMRELVICDAIMLELRRRGRQARHIYFADDLDAFRKVPANVPPEFSQYLGMPLCDVPPPDPAAHQPSYAEYFLHGLIESAAELGIEVEFIRGHQKYRSGFFVPAIEQALAHIPEIRQALETLSNRKLDDAWTPIQVMEKNRLKNRRFTSINTEAKTLCYIDADGNEQTVSYAHGQVKLDWRIDWPARWWLQGVHVEPFGREHASAGGSFDTGKKIMEDIFKAEPPLPVPYDSIHMVGDTKKMSASKGTALSSTESLLLLPAEVIRYFILRAPLQRPIYFDPVDGVVQLMDEFAALAAKPDKSEAEERLLYACTRGISKRTVSRVPFSHLVASYQAALKDPVKTLEVIGRTEHAATVREDAKIITAELRFIDHWLTHRAPQEVQFSLAEEVDMTQLTPEERSFLAALGERVAQAPADADGQWFHNAIYDLKDSSGLAPKELFTCLYRVLINKTSGPRAGWFLSILPREWLVGRLRAAAG